MAIWRDIEKSEEYQNMTSEEKSVRKVQFFNDEVEKSEKYKQMPTEQKNEIFEEMFPKGEYYKTAGRESIKGLWNAWTKLPGIKQADKAVEKIADFVEPEVPPGRTTFGLMTKDLPRQVGAEIIRAYKPSILLPFLGATKVIKPIVKPVAKAIGAKIPSRIKDVFLKEFTVGRGQPVAYQQLAKKAQLERLAGGREAGKVAEVLSTTAKGKPLPLEQQRYIGRIFRKEVIESPQLLKHPKYQQLKSISNEGRAIMDKWSKSLIDSGIPSKQAKQVIEDNVGQYMARMYRSKLVKSPQGFSFFKHLRMRLNGLKHKKDLSDEVLKQLGEIKEPALPTAIRVKEISTSVANNKLFKKVASNPEWTATENIGGKMVKMPDVKTVGALRNKWVIPEIASDVNAIAVANTEAQSLYMKGLSAWKYSKVVLNPATHVRNMISNSMLLDLSGVNHFRQLQLMPRVMRDYLTKGKMYKMALEDGAIGGEWVGGEVSKVRDFYLQGQGGNLQRWFNVVKMPFKKAGKLYQGEEQLSKLVKYTDVLSKGGSRQLAASEAQKWLFNYQEIPNAVKFAKHIAPFVTFTYKALPRVGEALVNNPMRLYKYYALFNGWNEASQKLKGMSPDEYARQVKALPPWLMRSIGGIPGNLLMPWDDKYGRTQWLNLEYILPVGMAPEVLEKGLLRGAVGNPIITLYADLSKNQDFRGKPIIPFGATKLEATKIAAEHIYRQLAPSLAPSLGDIKGGYSFEKIMDAVQERPDYSERTRELTPVLFDVFAGLKLNALDVDESERFKMFEKKKNLEDLRTQLLKLRHPAISEKEREKQAEQIFLKMQRVMEE